MDKIITPLLGMTEEQRAVMRSYKAPLSITEGPTPWIEPDTQEYVGEHITVCLTLGDKCWQKQYKELIITPDGHKRKVQ